MKKIRVRVPYYDLQRKETIESGRVFEVEDERADELIAKGIVVEVRKRAVRKGKN